MVQVAELVAANGVGVLSRRETSRWGASERSNSKVVFPSQQLAFLITIRLCKSHEALSRYMRIESSLSQVREDSHLSFIYHHRLDKHDVDAEAICVKLN